MKANEIRDLFNSFESIAIDYSGIAAKAKDLVDEMTYINLSRRSINRQVDVMQEHIDNENALRNMLLDRGIRPEALHAGEDVKKVERRLKADEKKILSKKKK